MLVEIRKVGFVNKGAELMLHALVDALRARHPGADIAMAPDLVSARYEDRSRFGFKQKASYWRKGVQFGSLAALLPPSIRRMYGVVLDSELDVVLDASGFGYSDQMGLGGTLELAGACRRWRKNGTKVVLLPQAFGPFESWLSRRSIRIAVKNADLIFARDPVSYEHLVRYAGRSENIRVAPDFTNLLAGRLPAYHDPATMRFCIVPNARMLQKTSKEEAQRYLPTMIACARYLKESGLSPFILNHEGTADAALAERIAAGVGGGVPVIEERDPIKIKGILGACDGIVGSRYHALVSGLSQGVPSLATGWSHKYQMLFADYGFPEGMLGRNLSDEQIHERLRLIADGVERQRIRAAISARSEKLKDETRRMWASVFEVIER